MDNNGLATDFLAFVQERIETNRPTIHNEEHEKSRDEIRAKLEMICKNLEKEYQLDIEIIREIRKDIKNLMSDVYMSLNILEENSYLVGWNDAQALRFFIKRL